MSDEQRVEAVAEAIFDAQTNEETTHGLARAAIAAYREALEASGWRIVDEATLRDAASAVQGLNSASATVKGREFHERLARLYRGLRSAAAPKPSD